MVLGCTATSAAQSIVFTIVSAHPTFRLTRSGITTINNNSKPSRYSPLLLDAKQRKSIEAAIRETCKIRKWSLLAFNIRTNHVHTVMTAYRKPELVLNAFKANATRQLREDGLWCHPFSPWADKGSKRRLWNERSVTRAIEYVLYDQGDELPDFDD